MVRASTLEKRDHIAGLLEQLRGMCPGVSRAEVAKALGRQASLHRLSPDTVLRNMMEQAEALGCRPAAIVKAALRAPALFGSKAATIAAKVDAGAAALGVEREKFVAAALKKPELLYLTADLVAANFSESATRLGISKAVFARMALRHQNLLVIRPDRLVANVSAVCAELDIPREAYVKASAKQPQLLYQKPDTLVGNVRRSAEAVGVSEPRFARAALRQPQLFYLRPETINQTVVQTAEGLRVGKRPSSVVARVELSAKLLGVSFASLARAGMVRSTLLLLRPANMAAKATALHRLAHAVGEPFAVAAMLDTFPQAFVYAVARMEAARLVAELGLRKRSVRSLLLMPMRVVEADLMAHFSRLTIAARVQVRALQELGFLQGLPATNPQDMPSQRLRAVALMLVLAVLALPGMVWGACSNPAGPEGSLNYDASSHYFRYCDDSDTWQAIGSGGGSLPSDMVSIFQLVSCPSTWTSITDSALPALGTGTTTAALLHMDGADASTSFTDSGNNPKTIVASGNAAVDTAQSKYGGASLLLDGSGDYVSAADANNDFDFGTGDFTWEAFVRWNSLSGTQGIMGGSAGGEWSITKVSGGGPNYYIGLLRASTAWDANVSSVAVALSTSTWYHIAFTRSGTTLRLFLDGVEFYNTTNSINYSTTSLRVGANGQNDYFNGWIDEVRITKGLARYTRNFAPPAAPLTLDTAPFIYCKKD